MATLLIEHPYPLRSIKETYDGIASQHAAIVAVLNEVGVREAERDRWIELASKGVEQMVPEARLEEAEMEMDGLMWGG